MVKELVPFLVAGDPDMSATERFVNTFVKEGVRTIELGVPFSDPFADGPTIQRSSARALSRGAKLTQILELCGILTRKHPDLKIVIFSYLNPLLRFGLERYVSEAKKFGVSGTLAVDLPLEESEEYVAIHRKYGLGTIFLASPTTQADRMKKIIDISSEFIYYISRTGVTGERSNISKSLEAEIDSIRRLTDKPLAVGFGISTPAQVRSVGLISDKVVIGSKFIQIIESSPSVEQAEKNIGDFSRDCLQELKALGGTQC